MEKIKAQHRPNTRLVCWPKTWISVCCTTATSHPREPEDCQRHQLNGRQLRQQLLVVRQKQLLIHWRVWTVAKPLCMHKWKIAWPHCPLNYPMSPRSSHMYMGEHSVVAFLPPTQRYWLENATNVAQEGPSTQLACWLNTWIAVCCAAIWHGYIENDCDIQQQVWADRSLCMQKRLNGDPAHFTIPCQHNTDKIKAGGTVTHSWFAGQTLLCVAWQLLAGLVKEETAKCQGYVQHNGGSICWWCALSNSWHIDKSELMQSLLVSLSHVDTICIKSMQRKSHDNHARHTISCHHKMDRVNADFPTHDWFAGQRREYLSVAPQLLLILVNQKTAKGTS